MPEVAAVSGSIGISRVFSVCCVVEYLQASTLVDIRSRDSIWGSCALFGVTDGFSRKTLLVGADSSCMVSDHASGLRSWVRVWIVERMVSDNRQNASIFHTNNSQEG